MAWSSLLATAKASNAHTLWAFFIEIKRKHIFAFINREPLLKDMQLFDKVYYVGASAAESGRLSGEIMAEYFITHPQAGQKRGRCGAICTAKGGAWPPGCGTAQSICLEAFGRMRAMAWKNFRRIQETGSACRRRTRWPHSWPLMGIASNA